MTAVAPAPTLLNERMGAYAQADWHAYYDTFLHLIPEGSRVLDVGAGRGGVAQWLTEKRRCEVTCVDGSKEALAACREKGLTTVQADLNSTDWMLPGTYDVVLFSSSLESLVDPRAAVAKVRDNLKPGGLLLIWLPNFSYIGLRLAYLIGRSVKQMGYSEEAVRLGVWGYDDIQFFTEATLGLMLREAGYTKLEWHRQRTPLDIRNTRNWIKKVAFWFLQLWLSRTQPDALCWYLCVVARGP